MSSLYRYSGYRSVEIKDVAGDGKFAELQGFFTDKWHGYLFIHFAMLIVETEEPMNIAFAGNAHFSMREHGLAIWLKLRRGTLYQVSVERMCRFSTSILLRGTSSISPMTSTLAPTIFWCTPKDRTIRSWFLPSKSTRWASRARSFESTRSSETYPAGIDRMPGSTSMTSLSRMTSLFPRRRSWRPDAGCSLSTCTTATWRVCTKSPAARPSWLTRISGSRPPTYPSLPRPAVCRSSRTPSRH